MMFLAEVKRIVDSNTWLRDVFSFKFLHQWGTFGIELNRRILTMSIGERVLERFVKKGKMLRRRTVHLRRDKIQSLNAYTEMNN